MGCGSFDGDGPYRPFSRPKVQQNPARQVRVVGLPDRALSRLLGEDWPRTLEDGGAQSSGKTHRRAAAVAHEYSRVEMRTLYAALLMPLTLLAQPSESNIVFGAYSGLALLMDVYKPASPNGYGIVVVPGSGWHTGLPYNANLLKQSREFSAYIQRLTAAGYAAFVVTHRAAPRFHFPDAVEDVQRAVRYVRHHAADYGIAKDRIGALGGSSGGHLVSMLGTLDGKGDAASQDPVEQQSSKVQCVVALYPVT